MLFHLVSHLLLFFFFFSIVPKGGKTEVTKALSDPKTLLLLLVSSGFPETHRVCDAPCLLSTPPFFFFPPCSCALFIDLLLCHTGHKDEYEMTNRRQRITR